MRDPSLAFHAQHGPRVSVIVPAHDSAVDLPPCLEALLASDLQRSEWELIVVDDSSSDSTADIASSRADKVIRLTGGAKGPAFARNRGAESAAAPVVAFVDADVMVHSDALRLMLAGFDDTHIAAVFGSYDDSPTAQGIVSQYRNLLHHFVHQQSAGEVDSFWAGLGAIRKDIFTSVGRFDENRFTRPEMEDVELGYRLRDSGHTILLDPQILCTHRKRWTLWRMIRSDFARRGVPWTRLLLERKMLLSPRGLSLGASERASAGFAAVFVTLTVAALVSGNHIATILAAATLVAFAVANRHLLGALAARNGMALAVMAVPLHLLYNLVGLAAVAWGSLLHVVSPSAPARYTPRR